MSQQRGVDSPPTSDRRFREFGTVSPLRVSSGLTLRAHLQQPIGQNERRWATLTEWERGGLVERTTQ
jgi:hypothetical protein